jgi:hypothetical protein
MLVVADLVPGTLRLSGDGGFKRDKEKGDFRPAFIACAWHSGRSCSVRIVPGLTICLNVMQILYTAVHSNAAHSVRVSLLSGIRCEVGLLVPALAPSPTRCTLNNERRMSAYTEIASLIGTI